MLGKTLKISLCLTLITGMICSGLADHVSLAAAKAKLKEKKMQLTVGQTKKIVITKRNKKAVYSFSSSAKTKASVSKDGTVTAKKRGQAKITVKEKYKKKIRSLGKVTVTIKAKSTDSEKKATPSPELQTQAPTQTPEASVAPSTVPGGDSSATKEPEQSSAPSENPTVTYKPIDQYVLDTDLSVPAGFMNVNPDVAGTVETITYDSTVIKENEVVKRKAKVILPKDYDPEKEYPVLYMQHGIFGNEDSLTGDNVQNVIWNAIANGDAEEMIAVFPNACANEYGAAVDSEGNPIGGDTSRGFNLTHYAAYNNFLNDLEQCLMPYINEKYSTLTGRENTAICGFSMGGRVTLHIGFTLQSKFRYIGAFCPAPGIFKHNDNGVDEEGLFMPQSTFTLQDEYMDDTLVLIAAGTNDGVVKEFPLSYHEALDTNGVPHIFYKTKGGDSENGSGGHDGTVYKHGLYNFLRRIFHLHD